MPDNTELVFDEKNPAKTVADLAGIEESEANEIIDGMSLTAYVALATAIQNKDEKQITEIIDKISDKHNYIEEDIEPLVKNNLQKLVSKIPQQPLKTNTSVSTPIGNKISTPAKPIVSTNANTPNIVSKPPLSTNISPTGSTDTPSDATEIVSADPDSQTIAVKDPKNQNKVSILSLKDTKQTPEIIDLMKRAGVTGVN